MVANNAQIEDRLLSGLVFLHSDSILACDQLQILSILRRHQYAVISNNDASRLETSLRHSPTNADRHTGINPEFLAVIA